MRFNYTYRITYGFGQCCDRSREQYGRIIEKVIKGCMISEVPGIEELVKLEDSRKNGMAMLMDTDQFLNLVVRW